jgi:hypothetical protein
MLKPFNRLQWPESLFRKGYIVAYKIMNTEDINTRNSVCGYKTKSIGKLNHSDRVSDIVRMIIKHSNKTDIYSADKTLDYMRML